MHYIDIVNSILASPAPYCGACGTVYRCTYIGVRYIRDIGVFSEEPCNGCDSCVSGKGHERPGL
jgi:hypothetical protein